MQPYQPIPLLETACFKEVAVPYKVPNNVLRQEILAQLMSALPKSALAKHK